MTKIALAHDYFVEMGGAERVAGELARLFPDAPLYTTVAAHERVSPELRARLRVSWMQHLPARERLRRHYFMLYPAAIASFDLSAYDVILSSTSGYAKGVRRAPHATHICYCHTPMRWVWRYGDYAARENFDRMTSIALPTLLAGLRAWDKQAAQRPDHYIANSHNIARRIKEIYGRDAAVIHPPIDVDRFKPSQEQDDYYLVLSRLVGYKRIDLAVEACTLTNRRLIVVGDGPDRARLERIAGRTVEFAGRVSDAEVARYAARARALIFPGEEDFGMTPLEVNAAGRPVIAFDAGGARETIVESETGLFFDRACARALAATLDDFETREWNQQALRRHAEGFDRNVFAGRMMNFVRSVVPSFEIATDHATPIADALPRLRTA